MASTGAGARVRRWTQEGAIVEVKIGIRDISREVVLETESTPDEVARQVEDAVSGGSLLRLTDEKGRQIVVPGSMIGYVEIGAGESRRVGFGNA